LFSLLCRGLASSNVEQFRFLSFSAQELAQQVLTITNKSIETNQIFSNIRRSTIERPKSGGTTLL